MKKICLFVVLFCLSLNCINAQTVNLIASQTNTGEIVDLDGAVWSGLKPESNYMIKFIIQLYNHNDWGTVAKDLHKGDTLCFDLIVEGKSESYVCVLAKDFLKDSTMQLYLSVTYPGSIFKEGENEICAKMTKVATPTYVENLSDEGTCVHVTVNFVTEVADNQYDEIVLYPNPANDILKIENAGQAKIAIYTSGGQLVKSLETEGPATIGTSDLCSGLYIVKIQRGDAITAKKIQIVR